MRPIAGVVELVIDDVETFGDRDRPDALVLDPPGHLGLDGEALVQPERAEALVGVDLEDARLIPGSGGVRVPDDRPVALGEHQVPAGGEHSDPVTEVHEVVGASGFILLTTCRRNGVFLTNPVTVVNTPRSSARSLRCHGVKPPVILPITSSIEYRKWMLHSASRWRIP